MKKTNKAKKDIIEAVVEFGLIYPYHVSQDTLIEMINKWNMRLISMGTYDEVAKVGIQKDKFKTIFGENPSVGEFEVPEGTKKFISSVKVTKIDILKG